MQNLLVGFVAKTILEIKLQEKNDVPGYANMYAHISYTNN